MNKLSQDANDFLLATLDNGVTVNNFSYRQ